MKKKNNRKKRCAAVIYVFAVLGVALILGSFFAIRYLVDNKLGNFTADAEIYVRPGDTPAAVVEALSPSVKRVGSLERCFASKKVEQYMQPGHYRFGVGTTSVFVARALNNGWQSPVRLTISGSLRLKGEIARKISAQMLMDSAAVANALSDKELLSRYGTTPSKVFSLIMPDTYEVLWTDGMDVVLARQKAAQDAFWTEERVARAKAVGLTREQAVVLASIVKGESRYVPELPKIAGVYLNRLRKGMKLQADPTVAYCYDYTLNRILKKHLKVDSPYNTYKYAGLPPGPINCPDRQYIEAVLAPDYGGGNMFFCADPSFNGSHRFARSYSEHMANARAFQRALSAKLRNSK